MSLLFDLLGYRGRWRLLEQLGPAHLSPSAPVVIGGCGSSGTTLLRRMLNRHPAIFCGPETTVFLKRVSAPDTLAPRLGFEASEIEAWRRGSRSQAEFIDRFQAACLERSGKPVWADKTPENIRRLDFIWRHFPRARFVHVIRDGRDVACSLRRQPWMKLRDRGPVDAIARCASYWAERVSIRRARQRDPRYTELRYENLVRDPEATLRPLLGFLGLEWSERILAPDSEHRIERAAGPASPSSVGRWRAELSEPEIAALKPVAAPLLIELGYERDSGWGLQSKAAD